MNGEWVGFGKNLENLVSGLQINYASPTTLIPQPLTSPYQFP